MIDLRKKVLRELKMIAITSVAILSSWVAVFFFFSLFAIFGAKALPWWTVFISVPIMVITARVAYMGMRWSAHNWRK